MRNTLLGDQTGSGGPGHIAGARNAGRLRPARLPIKREWARVLLQCLPGRREWARVLLQCTGRHVDGVLPARLAWWTAGRAICTPETITLECSGNWVGRCTNTVFVLRTLHLCRAHPSACGSELKARFSTNQVLGLRERPDQTGLFPPLCRQCLCLSQLVAASPASADRALARCWGRGILRLRLGA